MRQSSDRRYQSRVVRGLVTGCIGGGVCSSCVLFDLPCAIRAALVAARLMACCRSAAVRGARVLPRFVDVLLDALLSFALNSSASMSCLDWLHRLHAGWIGPRMCPPFATGITWSDSGESGKPCVPWRSAPPQGQQTALSVAHFLLCLSLYSRHRRCCLLMVMCGACGACGLRGYRQCPRCTCHLGHCGLLLGIVS